MVNITWSGYISNKNGQSFLVLLRGEKLERRRNGDNVRRK